MRGKSARVELNPFVIRAIIEPLERRLLLSGLAATGTTIQAIAGQTIDVGDIDGSGTLYVAPGVTISVDSVNEFALTVGGNLTLATPGRQNRSRNSLIGELNLTPQAGVTGTIDLTNNVLYIDYSGNADPIAAIRAYLTSGFNGGSWNGTGIISSDAASTNGQFSVGYADGNDGVVDGLPAGMIEVMYTLAGDANLDGWVNGYDFDILSADFNQGVSSWDQGDFDYNNIVNGIDFADLSANFNKNANTWSAPSYTIPAQYAATFTDSITTPLTDLSALVDWGDGSAPSAGAIVSDGNGTFHVVANHAYANAGNYQVTTTITDSNSNTSTQAISNAIVANTPFSAEPLDASDIQLTWAAQPILAGGLTLEYSTSPYFWPDPSTVSLAGNVTDYTVSGLSPGTLYYFELIPSTPSDALAAATTSVTTDPSDGNGGTAGPTAPTITQAATASQPSNTTLSLTMTATAPDGDPASYNWQQVSGPGGPPPQLTNSEQTTDVILSAAGTYDFRCTATDDSTGLSVSSDANATVDQVATSIAVSPGQLQAVPNSTVQFEAVVDDQFGTAMDTQPNLIWGIGGYYAGTGTTLAFNVGSLTDYTEIISAATASSPYVQGSAALLVNGAASGFEQVTGERRFSTPVNDLHVQILFELSTGNIYVFQNNVETATVQVSGAVGSSQVVDLSAYQNVTELTTGGVLMEGFTVTPAAFCIALGNGSANQILQGSDNGTQNPVPLSLAVPNDLPSGTQVTLSTTEPGEVDVWNSANPSPGSNPLLGGSGQTSSFTWTVGTDQIPTTLYVGATAGSQSVGDIQFTLSSNIPGSASATTQPATAVKVDILAENDPNNANIMNQDITGKTTNWLVGQMVDLQASVEAPPTWKTNLNYQWTVSGNTLYSYKLGPSGSTASETQLWGDNVSAGGVHTGYLDQNVAFFWQTATQQPQELDPIFVQVSGINGGTYTQMTNFSVSEPTVVNSPVQYGSTMMSSNGSSVTFNNVFAGVSFDSAIIAGVTLTDPGFAAGQWTLVQKADNDDELDSWEPNGTVDRFFLSTNYTWALDGPSFPYPAGAGATLWDPTILSSAAVSPFPTGTTYALADSPQSHVLDNNGVDQKVNGKTIYEDVRNDLYKIYVMFQPPGSNAQWNSQWVPVELMTWAFAVDAKDPNESNQWQLVSHTDPHTFAAWAPATDEPAWNILASSGVWRQQQ